MAVPSVAGDSRDVEVLTRRVLGSLNGSAEPSLPLADNAGGQLETDGNRALYTHGLSEGPTNATAPTTATLIAFVDGSGKAQAPSSSTPLPVTGTITAAPAPAGTPAGGSVAVTGTAAALSGSTSVPCPLSLTINPDPTTLCAIGLTNAVTTTPGLGVWLLEPGGLPLVFAGNATLNCNAVFVIGGGNVTFIAQ